MFKTLLINSQSFKRFSKQQPSSDRFIHCHWLLGIKHQKLNGVLENDCTNGSWNMI